MIDIKEILEKEGNISDEEAVMVTSAIEAVLGTDSPDVEFLVRATEATMTLIVSGQLSTGQAGLLILTSLETAYTMGYHRGFNNGIGLGKVVVADE